MLGDRSEDSSDVRSADGRLLLPVIPETATVLGDSEPWHEALAQMKVRAVPGGERPGLVVAPRAMAAEAVALGAEHVVLEGGGALSARRAGYQVRRFLPLPGLRRPEMIVPLDRPRVARYAQRSRSGPVHGWRRLRAAAAEAAVATGVVPPDRPTLVVASRNPGPPFVLRAAATLGVGPGTDWYLWLGRGDALQRAVFSIFGPARPDPSWVVKVGRLPGVDAAFARDEAALLALPPAPAVTDHAPRFMGRASVAGLPLSAESAAVGSKLSAVMSGRDRVAALQLVDAVTDWLYDLARATCSGSDDLADEVDRLDRDIIALWAGESTGDVAQLLGAARLSPAVMQHNDVGCWNIVADPPAFTVLDWESACAHGLPLWDLMYFLVDAFAEMDRTPPAGRVDHAITLLSGRSQWSPKVFSAVRRFVSGLQVPPASVGPIVTLGWLHHGSSALRRAQRLQLAHARDDEPKRLMESLARRWLVEPDLGPGWDAWMG